MLYPSPVLIKVAEQQAVGAKGKYKIGCSILYGNGEIFSGHNTYKTHPIQAKWAKMMGEPGKIHLHAEINALIKGPGFDQARPWIATVIRVNKKGEWRLAKPCPICMFALQQSCVNRVYWSTGKNKDIEHTYLQMQNVPYY